MKLFLIGICLILSGCGAIKTQYENNIRHVVAEEVDEYLQQKQNLVDEDCDNFITNYEKLREGVKDCILR